MWHGTGNCLTIIPEWCNKISHYNDVIMSAMVSQVTSLTIVYSTIYLDADQRKHQSSASLAFVRGIHRGPVNSPHKEPVTRKMFPFDDAIMTWAHEDTITNHVAVNSVVCEIILEIWMITYLLCADFTNVLSWNLDSIMAAHSLNL